jgi:hypothetical protein
MSVTMNLFLNNVLKHADAIDAVPIYKCGPSSDPDEQYAYSSAFRDSVASFLFYAKKIQDPFLQELLVGIDDNIDSGKISDSHAIKSKLNVVIEYLKELQNNSYFKEVIFINESFVDAKIISRLLSLSTKSYDLQKLNKYIEELNYAYQSEHYLSSILLIRAVMNHIPPIFNATNFSQVVANSKRSVKAILSIMEDSARPIADLHTHMMIREKELIPTKNQVEPYKAAFELLLNEIIYELEEKSE